MAGHMVLKAEGLCIMMCWRLNNHKLKRLKKLQNARDTVSRLAKAWCDAYMIQWPQKWRIQALSVQQGSHFPFSP